MSTLDRLKVGVGEASEEFIIQSLWVSRMRKRDYPQVRFLKITGIVRASCIAIEEISDLLLFINDSQGIEAKIAFPVPEVFRINSPSCHMIY